MDNENINLDCLILHLETLFNVETVRKSNELIFGNNINIKVNITELKNILKDIKELNFDNDHIYEGNNFEELVHIESPTYYGFRYLPHKERFGDDNIKYELSKPSLKYIIISIFRLFNKNIELIPPLFSEWYYKGRKVYPKEYFLKDICNKMDFNKKFKIGSGIYDFSLKSYFDSEFLDYSNNDIRTMKIAYEKELTFNEFVKHSNAYRFWLNYYFQPQVITRFKFVEKQINLMTYRKKVNLNHNRIPQKFYNEEILHYYEQGLLSDDPVFSYISFYHILEYFYENVNVENLIDNLENHKTEYKSFYLNNGQIDVKLHKIIRKACLGEKDKLIQVLNKFLDKKRLLNDIDKVENIDYDYFLNTNIPWAKKTKLKNEENNFNERIANRIYKVRNALVHRKETDQKKYVINIKEDENALYKELSLIQLVAEQIIMESADDLDIA